VTTSPIAARALAAQQTAAGAKPNIFIMFGDDVGQTNISAYGLGVVRHRCFTATSTRAPIRGSTSVCAMAAARCSRAPIATI
jgi:hypothetical protein